MHIYERKYVSPRLHMIFFFKLIVNNYNRHKKSVQPQCEEWHIIGYNKRGLLLHSIYKDQILDQKDFS